MLAIEIKNFVKDYTSKKGIQRAVDHIDLNIEEGEFFGLLGPNGAGKTTTINVLTGLATKTGGTVKVFGHDVVKDYQQSRRLIGLSPQEFNYDPFLTIREILIYQAGFFDITRKVVSPRADELLYLFGLSQKANLEVKNLSGGMKRRLAIARAMIHQPKILILDEPTAGLDVELRVELWDYIRKLNKEGATILLTTHYLEEAENLCERIGIMNNGKMLKIDRKEKIINLMSKDSLKFELDPAPLEKDFTEFSEHWIEGNRIIISMDQAENKIADIIFELKQKEYRILKSSIHKQSLEEVFLKLMEQENENHSSPEKPFRRQL